MTKQSPVSQALRGEGVRLRVLKTPLLTAHVVRQNRWVDMLETIDAGPITLQRWTVDRADSLNQAINESLPELMLFLPWATTDHGMNDTLGYLQRSSVEWDNGENFSFAMVTPEGDVVGSGGLLGRQGPGVLEIGYWVHSAHTSRGLATAAVLALAEAGLEWPGIDHVEIHHDVENHASGRVAAKAGFQELGVIPAERQAPRDSGTDLVWARNSPR